MTTSDVVMMGCGHVANSVVDGKPACVICAGIDPRAYVVVEAPDLAGRMASCSCGKTVPSDSPHLAFFEYRGPGSRYDGGFCECGYAIVAHTKKQAGERVSPRVCDDFTPRALPETDSYYCGCRGWD